LFPKGAKSSLNAIKLSYLRLGVMDKRQSSGCKEASNQSLGSFARWFSGHDLSTGVHCSRTTQSPYERYFSYRSLVNRPARARNLASVLTLSLESTMTEKITQMIHALRSQDWLQPLPNLKSAFIKRKVAPPMPGLYFSRRDEFLMYGSKYLERRQDLENGSREYSRAATFFAGSLLDRSWVDFDGQVESRRGHVAALSLRSSRALASSDWLNGPWAACQSWLRKLSTPPSLIGPEFATQQALYDLSRFQLVQQWPFRIAIDPWSTSFQLSTAVVIALPAILSSVQMPAAKLNPVLPTPDNDIAQTTTTATSTTASVATAPVPNVQAAPTVITAPEPGYVLDTKTNEVRKQILAAAPTSTPTLPSQLKTPKYQWPAEGAFTSGYGWRWGRMHRGVDIAGPVGTPVRAAADGKVITARWDSTGFGYMVEIEHPDKSVTLYGHNDRLLIKQGAQVRQGQQIAEMGSTGNSTGSHVHFQVHPKGKDAVDPIFFLAKQGPAQVATAKQ
jgi:murein DD-endopeptidase MepM/ murein hydrolase activator NlpD